MISRRILAAVALLCAFIAPAQAQKTKAALTAEINANWPDNSIGVITPATLRSTVIDIVNSYIDANGGSSLPCATHQWIAAIATLSSVTCTQPAFGDLSGSIAPSQIPAPTATTLGGIESIVALSHNWIAYIDTSGAPHQSQPAFTDISGTLGYSQGGCNATTQVGCTNNIFPTPTRAGDLVYWNGTAWVALAGNNSGNQILQENSSGVPSWVAASGIGTVTSVACGAGLTGGTFTSSGTCAIDFTRNNIWTGSNAFSNGKPVCDVTGQSGGSFNGTGDDTTPIMACVNYLNTNYASTGGIVLFPSSATAYCTYTGITDGSGAAPITFMGAGMQALSVCGHNGVSALTTNHQQPMAENLILYGYGNGATDTFGVASAATLSCGSGASYAVFRHLYVAFGSFPIEAQCSGARFEDITVQYGYGDGSGTRSANAYILNSGQYWSRVSFDQVLPATPAPTFPTTVAAWASAHVYAKGTVVTVTCVTRSWYIQASVAGTSGGSSPTCKNYGQNITDNTVTWLLVAPSPFYLVQVDTGGNEVFFDHSDMTGFATANFAMTNTFAGTPPTNVHLTDSTPGGAYTVGVDLKAGSNFHWTGADFQGCILSGCAGLFAESTYGTGITMSGVTMHNGMSLGVLVAASLTQQIYSSNFIIGAVTNAFSFGASVDVITGIGNVCTVTGRSGGPGANGYFPTGTAGNPGC